MKVATLNARHPCCDIATFKRYDLLYRGGVAFQKSIGDFLLQNPLEAPEVYTLRKREAAYRSYVGPIVDFFAAQLFSAPFLVRARSGDGKTEAPAPFYATFREDVDGVGTDLAAFLKQRFTTALVKGCAWWVAEMPDDGEPRPPDRAGWEARGLGRARLCALEPDDVLDWETDDAGQLLWVITHRREQRRDDPRADRALVTETWKLYDAETVETFRIVYDPKKRKLKPEDEIPSVGRAPHYFPRVPVVQMRLPEGLWLLNRAADAQVEHFRLSAAESWALKRCAYPMAIFKSADGSGPGPTAAGAVKIMGVSESLEWVAPPATSFEVLSKEIYAQMTEIYRVSQQMAHAVNNSAAALDRSGESKQADHEATEICLHAYASEVKTSIETTFELVSDGREDTDVVFSIEGMNHFNLDDVTAAMGHLKVAKELSIPSKTLTKELAAKAADLLLPDASQGVKDTIRGELEEAAEKPPEPPPAPPGLPGAPPPNGPPGGPPPPVVTKPQPTAA